MIYPNKIKKSATVEEFHGIEVVTAYAEFDDIGSQNVRNWLHAQAGIAKQYISMGDYEKILSELKADRLDNRLRPLLSKGSVEYEVFQHSSENHPTLYINNHLHGTRKAIYNTATVDAEYVSISPSGRYVVYALSRADYPEVKTIRVFDSEIGQILFETSLPSVCPQIAWHPEEQGFYYSAVRKMFMATCSDDPDGVYWCDVRHDAQKDKCIYPYQSEKGHAALPYVLGNGQYLLIKQLNFSTNKSGLIFLELSNTSRFSVLFSEAESSFNIIGDFQSTLFVETDGGEGKGRVIHIDLNKPARENWREVFTPDSGRIVQSSHSVQSPFTYLGKDYIAVSLEAEGCHFIQIIDWYGNELKRINFPSRCAVTHITETPQNAGFKVRVEEFLAPFKEYEYDSGGGQIREEKSAGLELDNDFDVIWDFCEGEDGVCIPVTIIKRTDVSLKDGMPIILSGYGGFGHTYLPGYKPEIAYWVKKGWIYAIAHVRGGGEYGRAWHEAGRLENKPNSIKDFVTVATWLKTQGGEKHVDIVAKGESNGGLLVAASVLKEPSLFAAAIMEIPLLDVLCLTKSDWGRAVSAEYGDPGSSMEIFNCILGYSPLHNISDTQCYPPLLIVTAGKDNPVLLSSAYKFVAALQTRVASDQIIILKELEDVGHIGWPNDVRLDAIAYEQAFLSRVFNRRLAK